MPIDLNATLAASDPDIAAQIENEILRQHEGLEMIASENFVSRAVLEAAGTIFTTNHHRRNAKNPTNHQKPTPPKKTEKP